LAGFVFPFLWGLVVVSSFIGWGLIAARLAGVKAGDSPDWGLSAGWGMALVLVLGGVLSVFGLAQAPVLIAVVAAGAAMHLANTLRRPPSLGGLSGPALGLAVLVALVLILRYSAAVWYQGFNCGDDDVAYFTYVSRLLQTGTLIEPFSLRRLSGYGGHSFLQALVVMAGSEDNGFLMDRGIAAVVSFGLVAGFLRTPGKPSAMPYVVALILTVIMPFPLMNSMFLTLFRTLERAPPWDEGVPARYLWLIGAVAAGASSLKAHFLAAAAVTVFFYWLISVFRSPKGFGGGWRRHGWPLLHLGLSPLVFLAPWMALLRLSSGTILFPLFQGNHRPGFSETYSGAVDFTDLLAALGDFFISPRVALLVVPVVLYAFRRGSAAGLSLYMGALVASAVTVSTLTYDTLEALHRYVAPFLYAAFMSTVIFHLSDFHRNLPADATDTRTRPASRFGNVLLVVLVIALLPIPVINDLGRMADKFGRTVLSNEDRAQYSKMQSAVPEGELFLAVVGHPFALDYTRNTIINIDVPGGVSPHPGMPFFEGPRALKDYLLGQSIGYIAFRNFNNPGGCIYRRNLWAFEAKGDNPMWRAQSKFYLDFMDNVLALAETETTIYRGNILRVIKLR
jgi:hypothetical protein